jgi:hypothetical protein
MKYNDPNYHTINYSNYSLKELYEERINIINNNYNYNPKSLYKLVDNIESEILKDEKGMILLVNLQIIAENRRKLEYNYCNKEENKYLFLKLLECVNNCEVILDLKKNSLLDNEEKIYNCYLNSSQAIKIFINEFKEKLLFCGCNDSINID